MSPILEASLEIKKNNIKDTPKRLQYNVIMAVIDEFQQLSLFVFELPFFFFFVISDISVKLIVKFYGIFSITIKKKCQSFKKMLYFYKILGL